jgi:hypothetical protein
MTTKITAAVMLMLTLSGCADLPPQLTAFDGRLCQSYGIKPDEPAYPACLTQVDMARTGRSCFGSCH